MLAPDRKSPALAALTVLLLLGMAGSRGVAAAGPATNPGASPAGSTPAKAPALRVSKLSFMIGHRVFTEFKDQASVKLNERFRVGDSEYSAKAVEFQPDFTMDLKSRKVTSRSSEPRNPAVRVIVWKNNAPEDTSWAFLNMPPHFARNSMLAFRLLRVEFENHAALDAPKEAPTDALHDSTVTGRARGTKP